MSWDMLSPRLLLFPNGVIEVKLISCNSLGNGEILVTGNENVIKKLTVELKTIIANNHVTAMQISRVGTPNMGTPQIWAPCPNKIIMWYFGVPYLQICCSKQRASSSEIYFGKSLQKSF